MHMCLCVRVSVFWNTSSEYKSLSICSTHLVKATNHSIIAADTEFLHDVTFVSEQIGVLLILILPHGMKVAKLLASKQDTFIELRKNLMMVSHPFYISQFSEEIIQDSFY